MDTGNISTIITWIYVLISPFLVKYGITIDQTTFVTFGVALCGIIIAIWSSYNPNTFKFLNNDKLTPTPTVETECFDNDAPVLNEEYETEFGDDDGC